MTEFDNLKNTYISVIQWGLNSKVGYIECKRGNDILHKFCDKLIENCNYSTTEKEAMKNELDCVKYSLSKEIENYYIG